MTILMELIAGLKLGGPRMVPMIGQGCRLQTAEHDSA